MVETLNISSMEDSLTSKVENMAETAQSLLWQVKWCEV
jgi:hypothetical protein